MNTIKPFLWFASEAEEAARYYAAIFPHARVASVTRAGDQVIAAEFEIEGQPFVALNGNPHVAFTESVSFFVGCDTQQKIDLLWQKLTAGGGKPGQCGWLKDKYGVSWQIVPNALGRMLSDPDNAKSGRVMHAMLQMSKLDIAGLDRAYEGA
jgi:predicted 3-demethylubiquinone-9 3-methyltransferase (glyoxalase superfamily)